MSGFLGSGSDYLFIGKFSEGEFNMMEEEYLLHPSHQWNFKKPEFTINQDFVMMSKENEYFIIDSLSEKAVKEILEHLKEKKEYIPESKKDVVLYDILHAFTKRNGTFEKMP